MQRLKERGMLAYVGCLVVGWLFSLSGFYAFFTFWYSYGPYGPYVSSNFYKSLFSLEYIFAPEPGMGVGGQKVRPPLLS